MTTTLASAERPRLDAPEAVMDGLRLLWREPKTWLAWSAMSLAFSLLVAVGLVALSGPALASLSTVGARPNPAFLGAAVVGALPGYGLSMVLSLGFYAVAYAGVNRALLRPGEGGWLHLKLGADELKQGLLFLLIGVLMIAVYVGLLIAIFVIVAAAGMAAAMGGSGAGAGAGLLAAIVILAAVMGSLALFIWVGVRLSLASALTFDTGRVRLFGSWRLTRGVFWPLFGAYLLAFVVMALIGLATFVVSGLVALATGGFAAMSGSVLRPDMASFAGYFTPARIVQTVVSAAIYPAVMAVLAGAPASAYAQIVRSGAVVPGGRLGDARAEVFGPST